MVQVYAEPLSKRYLAPRSSLAWGVKVLFFAVVILVPYFIGFASYSFFKRQETYREQPSVAFQRQLILVVERQGDSALSYSTIPEYNALVGSKNLRIPKLTTTETDSDFDGKNDMIDIGISFPLRANERVSRVSLLLFFQLTLGDRVNLVMQPATFVQESNVASSGPAGSDLQICGDLAFQQLNPISMKSTRNTYDSPIISGSDMSSVDDILLFNILSKNLDRNESLSIERATPLWVPGQLNEFKVDLHLRVPTQDVTYIPGVAEVLKFAWVQYLALFWAVYYISSVARAFVYRHHVVHTRQKNDTVPHVKMHQF